ncbi:MAG: hypothetical protein R3A80_06120 [Bdellovibrionota bacterium]
MKKLLVMGFLLGSFAQAELSEEVQGAFKADREVQRAMRDLRRDMREILPGCNFVAPVENIDGHLFAAGVVKTGNNISRFNRTYLVSQGLFCDLNNGRILRRIRRSVTAKVQVTVTKAPPRREGPGGHGGHGGNGGPGGHGGFGGNGGPGGHGGHGNQANNEYIETPRRVILVDITNSDEED